MAWLLLVPSLASAATVAPSSSRPLGVSYPEWGARWAQWALGSPLPSNPLANPDDCALGDMGKVWFLSAAVELGVSTHCSIPTGTALLFTPGGEFCSAAFGDGTTEQQLDSCALNALAGITSVSASLDGNDIDVISHAVVSPLFQLQLTNDNLFGVPAGSYPTVAAGYFLVLFPLTPGRHTLTAYDAGFNGPGSEASFTYHITVG
jgi:hypothetical protein